MAPSHPKPHGGLGDELGGHWRAFTAAVSLTTVGILPVLLMGALAPFIAGDLELTIGEVGLAAGVFFLASAASSVPAGRVVAQIGSRASGWLSGTMSVAALLAMATIVNDTVTLLGVMVIGGIGNAAGQLATNLMIATAIRGERQGLAFGIKQAAIPLAALLGGAAVPTLALGIGWRWAFAFGPVFLALWAATAPSTPDARKVSERQRRVDSRDGGLRALSVAAALAAGAATGLTTFLVAWAISIGVSASDAGLLLSAASASAIVSRFGAGWAADRLVPDPMRIVAAMMAAGGAGVLLLAFELPTLALVGGVIGLGAGWGWNGLLHYAVVRANPEAPAQATGTTQVGVYLGGVFGPVVAGALIDRLSYQLTWVIVGLAFGVAAVLVESARRRAQPASKRQAV